MGVTVHSLKAKEWIDAISSNKNFIDKSGLYYTALIDFIKYIDDEFDSWSRYYIRVTNYFRHYECLSDLYILNTLGKDKIWDFVSNHKGEFGLWLRDRGDDFILRSISEYNHSIMDFKDNWFNKDDDMFVSLCCKFIIEITIKLLRFVELNKS